MYEKENNVVEIRCTGTRCPFCGKVIDVNRIRDRRYELCDGREALDCPSCGTQLIIDTPKRVPKKKKLIIQPKIDLKQYQLDEMHEDFVDQYKSGVVVVPKWCDIYYM